MSQRENAKWWFAMLVAGLLAGFITFAYRFDYLESELKSKMATLSRENQALSEENERLRYINSMAIEFSMDPAIVTVVDHYSREYLKKGGPEWRLLKTPEFATYIMLSLIYAESKGDPSAVGDDGQARGLTQIWVSTAKDYGEVDAEELLDPETNVSFAFKHFHHLLKKYSGNLALTLYAWNRGTGKVDKLLIYGESPQNGYAKKVYEAALLRNREAVIGN